MKDRLGVVVLTHGVSREATELAASLREEGVPASAIVIVHNPTSPDDPSPEAPDGVEVMRMERNAGYAAGMNAGIRRQLRRDVDFVLTLTHEVRFHTGALDTLFAAFESEADFGVVGPALWWRERDCPLSFGGRRRPRGGLEHIRARPEASRAIGMTDWVDGAAMLFRAEVLERVGLLEERFFIYVEDAEICLRAEKAGWRVGVVLDAFADAAPGGDTRPGAWVYLATRNGLEYSRRVSGARGVAWELTRRIKGAARLVGAYAIGSKDQARRARSMLELRALARGALDFFRGRWGPPPPELAGIGDIAGTATNG